MADSMALDETALAAISPIDGRYATKTAPLRDFFSEQALIRYRILVEVEYLIALRLLPLPQLESCPVEKLLALRDLYKEYKPEYALRVKAIERTTNHDVKAVEYFLKEQLEAVGLSAYREFVHFGLTSQDINNTAFPLMLKYAAQAEYFPRMHRLVSKLKELAIAWKDFPMLAHTHGQPATPTRLGKEVYVFVERLTVQLQALRVVPVSAKFGGATGNLNAHYAAYPQIDWEMFANKFVNDTLGLDRSKTTTQIEHYDNLAATCDGLRRINTILIDLCRDFWLYISMDYFRQVVVPGEVGSSAMPHKVNPIDFENAEGNLGMANAVYEFLAQKLPISRMQRDLTDSTVIRNIGVPIAHTVIAIESILRGFGRIAVHTERMHEDLEAHWVVVSEALQTILRREGYPNAYEALKRLTRTALPPKKAEMEEFIDSLEVSDRVKAEMRAITPFNYLGLMPEALRDTRER